jgi:hypothetical protein
VEVPEELKLAIEFAARTEAAGGRTAAFAREMTRLLLRVEKKLAARPAQETVSRTARGTDERIEYVVERPLRGHEETLAEHRTSGKGKPFRCSKGLYESMVKVLAAAERVMSVEEIASAVEQVLGGRPAEFHVRIPLRLWMVAQPPLLTRVRARYKPIDPKTFSSATQELWEKLKP